jgi:CheY-like chemotaxis protein
MLTRMQVEHSAAQNDASVGTLVEDSAGTLTLRSGKFNLPILSTASLPRAFGELLSGLPSSESNIADAIHPSRSVYFSNILVVEDNDINREIIKQQLHCLGIEADAVDSGDKALAHFLRSQPRAMLVDCQMPGMDGFELTRRLRALEEKHGGQRTLIVAITANATVEDKQRCLDAGMDDFLPKPLTRQNIQALLIEWKIITE